MRFSLYLLTLCLALFIPLGCSGLNEEDPGNSTKKKHPSKQTPPQHKTREITQADRKKIKNTKLRLKRISDALYSYKNDTGQFPGLLKHLISPPENSNLSDWNGPYLNKLWKDAWGQLFQYSVKENGFKLYSLGADGRFGGTGADRDIYLR